MNAHAKDTMTTVTHHLEAFFHKSIDGVVEDYAEDAIFIVPTGPLRGRDAIRGFFAAFIDTMPAGFLEKFAMREQKFSGELGYIVWDAAPWVRFATDTFVVRDGKIVQQTFAADPASW